MSNNVVERNSSAFVMSRLARFPSFNRKRAIKLRRVRDAVLRAEESLTESAYYDSFERAHDEAFRGDSESAALILSRPGCVEDSEVQKVLLSDESLGYKSRFLLRDDLAEIVFRTKHGWL